MEFQYHISEMAAETAAADFVKEFVQVEKFLSACQQCPNYNTRWTCPPFDFDPMTIWSGCTPASCMLTGRISLWTERWRR